MMFIDENSSPMLKSAYDKGKEEGIKECMERAVRILELERAIKWYAYRNNDNRSTGEILKAISKEIK